MPNSTAAGPALDHKREIDAVLDLLEQALTKLDTLGDHRREAIHVSEAIERLRERHDPITKDSNLPLVK